MDGSRFDDLARGLAVGASRRRVLKALAGSALAGLAGLAGAGRASAACAGFGRRCTTTPCCAELGLTCSRGVCGCPAGATPCNRTGAGMACVSCPDPYMRPTGPGCSCECIGGLRVCGNACVNVLTDPRNCGGCAGTPGHEPCGPEETCSGGRCRPLTCRPDHAPCDHRCVPACPEGYNADCTCASPGCPEEPCPVAGQFRNPDTCACACPPGTDECGDRCVEVCTGAKELNPGSCQCECPAGTTDCGNDCGTNADCAHFPGSILDPSPGTHCVCTCPSGTVRCGSPQRCEGPCSEEGAIRDPITCECVCPIGTVPCSGACYTDGNCHASKPGTILDPITCECVCPSGATDCGDSCATDAACAHLPGSVLDPSPGTHCLCVCPSGTTACGGACVQACNGGKALNANCECGCPTGTVDCNGQCVPEGPCCPPPKLSCGDSSAVCCAHGLYAPDGTELIPATEHCCAALNDQGQVERYCCPLTGTCPNCTDTCAEYPAPGHYCCPVGTKQWRPEPECAYKCCPVVFSGDVPDPYDCSVCVDPVPAAT